jgi:hypothetical protein
MPSFGKGRAMSASVKHSSSGAEAPAETEASERLAGIAELVQHQNAPFSLNKRGKSIEESVRVRQRIISAKEMCSGSKGQRRSLPPLSSDPSHVAHIFETRLDSSDDGRARDKCEN